ncbi:type II toxin-antitoxin system RelE/ParE family toxin [Dokdonella sp.]|uniref:type II toxin-antitoxin system RelE/ParE family toxin n=1 Tax=Dokdonella sp. TaxID=2291710 RepID=UPI0027B924E6|nr:type II toxin-antitoxin system RelE/ParE family toxin [Dokdonella sp.]
MAQVVWTEPAVADLEAVADYIAIENPSAAGALIQRIIQHARQLADHPESGSRPRELGARTRYRQIVQPPCRIFYRFDGSSVFIVHVMRTERLLRRSALRRTGAQT